MTNQTKGTTMKNNPQVYAAVYDRYHTRYEEEFDTPQEAYNFLNSGIEYQTHSAVGIKTPEGELLTVEEAKARLPIKVSEDDWL